MLSGQEMDQTYYTVPGATDHSGKARWRHCWSHAIEVMCVQQTRYARVESVVWLTNKTNWQFIWWYNTTKRTFNKANSCNRPKTVIQLCRLCGFLSFKAIDSYRQMIYLFNQLIKRRQQNANLYIYTLIHSAHASSSIKSPLRELINGLSYLV